MTNSHSIARKERIVILFVLTAFVIALLLFLAAHTEADETIAASEQIVAIEKTKIKITALMAEHHIPGLSIALVNENGVIWSEGFGHTDKTAQHPVSDKTLFNIGPISTNLTALSILFAAQEGLLDLNQPITHYLPQLKINSIYEHAPENKITLKHLLSHTAGFTREAPVGNHFDGAQADYNQHMQSIFDNAWLKQPVGAFYSWSTIGIDIAGFILQDRMKQPFMRAIQRNTLTPLNMNRSTFNIDAVKKMSQGKVAQGHIDVFDTMTANRALLPSSGMYSNADDMAKLLTFYLKNGVANHQQYITNKWLAKMFNIPYKSNTQQTKGYGLGIVIDERNQALNYSHEGRSFGFSAIMKWYPKQKLGTVVMINHQGSEIDTEIADYLLDQLIIPMDRAGSANIIAGQYISDADTIELSRDNHQWILQQENKHHLLEQLNNNDLLAIKNGTHYRYVKKTELIPAYILRLEDGKVWFLNEPAKTTIGPNREEWQQYVGDYVIQAYDRQIPINIHLHNGHLYLNDYKLTQLEPGLFRQANGERVDLRNGSYAYRNILMKKR